MSNNFNKLLSPASQIKIKVNILNCLKSIILERNLFQNNNTSKIILMTQYLNMIIILNYMRLSWFFKIYFLFKIVLFTYKKNYLILKFMKILTCPYYFDIIIVFITYYIHYTILISIFLIGWFVYFIFKMYNFINYWSLVHKLICHFSILTLLECGFSHNLILKKQLYKIKIIKYT